jgi:hypothetical protein
MRDLVTGSLLPAIRHPAHDWCKVQRCWWPVARLGDAVDVPQFYETVIAARDRGESLDSEFRYLGLPLAAIHTENQAWWRTRSGCLMCWAWAVLALLSEQSPGQRWWLGYLDTGADDVVLPGAPTVTLYSGWQYVLVEAGRIRPPPAARAAAGRSGKAPCPT